MHALSSFLQAQKFNSIYQHKVDRQLSGYIQKFERAVDRGWQSLDMSGEDPVDVVLADQVDLVDVVKLGRLARRPAYRLDIQHPDTKPGSEGGN